MHNAFCEIVYQEWFLKIKKKIIHLKNKDFFSIVTETVHKFAKKNKTCISQVAWKIYWSRKVLDISRKSNRDFTTYLYLCCKYNIVNDPGVRLENSFKWDIFQTCHIHAKTFHTLFLIIDSKKFGNIKIDVEKFTELKMYLFSLEEKNYLTNIYWTFVQQQALIFLKLSNLHLILLNSMWWGKNFFWHHWQSVQILCWILASWIYEGSHCKIDHNIFNQHCYQKSNCKPKRKPKSKKRITHHSNSREKYEIYIDW